MKAETLEQADMAARIILVLSDAYARLERIDSSELPPARAAIARAVRRVADGVAARPTAEVMQAVADQAYEVAVDALYCPDGNMTAAVQAVLDVAVKALEAFE